MPPRRLLGPALLLLASTTAFGVGTHCSRQETVIFSCALANAKVVSVCLGDAPVAVRAALSYRFGPLGTPELVFPRSPELSLAQFRYAHYFRYQTDRAELSFSNSGAEYAVFDHDQGEHQKRRYARGVRIAAGKTNQELLCKGQVVSRLSELETLVPCDVENALASCR